MKKDKVKIIIIFGVVVVSCFMAIKCEYTIKALFNHNQYITIVDDIFKLRNECLVNQDKEKIKDVYETQTKYGVWALEHEITKMKYLDNWSKKQGVEFNDIKTKIKLSNIKVKQESILINFTASTQYHYNYTNQKNKNNMFRIGTYHYMSLKKIEDSYVIEKEWYTDPFADSLHLDDIKHKEINDYILSQSKRDFSNLNQRRVNLVKYADKYCGGAADEEFGFKYNKEYRNYNPLGGDCANFASQMLYEGAGFKKNATWNYEKDASKAWVNAHAFKNYMVYSGRGYGIDYGNYDKVYKSAYKMLPGDFVAYEKKGRITHISVVTDQDSRGYPLVNCHNTDRYRVPWDLGWSDKDIKFHLIGVNY